MALSNTLWAEKYRPTTLDEYVFTDQSTRQQIETWVKDKSVPHLLLHGSAGTGKTTLAKVLVNELDIDHYDFLQVNASRDNGVDFLKDKIENFISTIPLGYLKIVLLDEADYLSPPAQAILRGLMESYSSTSRFILTCNFKHRIIDPLKSRCTELQIEKTDQTEFMARAAQILLNENIEFDIETLENYVRVTYPDLRKCLNMLQSNSGSKVLLAPTVNEKNSDYRFEMVELFKSRNFKKARELICSQIRTEEIEDLYRWAYDNLDLWSQTDAGQDESILIIRRGLVNHVTCGDPEINLAATLIELSHIDK